MILIISHVPPLVLESRSFHFDFSTRQPSATIAVLIKPLREPQHFICSEITLERFPPKVAAKYQLSPSIPSPPPSKQQTTPSTLSSTPFLSKTIDFSLSLSLLLPSLSLLFFSDYLRSPQSSAHLDRLFFFLNKHQSHCFGFP